MLTLALGSSSSRSGSVARAEVEAPFLFLGIVSVSSSIRLQGEIGCSCGDEDTGGARERETGPNSLPSTQLRPVYRASPAQKLPSARGWKRYLERDRGGARVLALTEPQSPPSRSRTAPGAPLRPLTAAVTAWSHRPALPRRRLNGPEVRAVDFRPLDSEEQRVWDGDQAAGAVR